MPQTQALAAISSIYRPATNAWQLESQTVHDAGASGRRRPWTGVNGWQQDFARRQTAGRRSRSGRSPLETPDYFETEQPIAEMMTVPQLKRYIDELVAPAASTSSR